MLFAVAFVLLAGAVLAAALGTAGGVAVGEQSVPSSPRLRGVPEAAVGANDARTPSARASRVAAAPEGAGSAAAFKEEDISDSAKTLEQTNARAEELESMPSNILSNATAEGSWDKEPAATSSVSNDSVVTVVANVYE